MCTLTFYSIRKLFVGLWSDLCLFFRALQGGGETLARNIYDVQVVSYDRLRGTFLNTLEPVYIRRSRIIGRGNGDQTTL